MYVFQFHKVSLYDKCYHDSHYSICMLVLLQTWTLCWDIQDTWTSEWDGRRELEAQSGPVLSLWLSPPDLRSNSSYLCMTSGEAITRDNSRGSGKLRKRKRLYNKTISLHVGNLNMSEEWHSILFKRMQPVKEKSKQNEFDFDILIHILTCYEYLKNKCWIND